MRLRETWRAAQRISPFGANTAITAFTNMVSALLALMTGVMAARMLAPHGRGELAAIQAWPNILVFFVHLGTADAVAYYSACEPDRAGVYLTSALVLSLLSSVPFMFAAYAGMPFLLHAQSAAMVAEARLFLLMVPVSMLVSMPPNALRGRSDFVVWNCLRVLSGVVWLGTLVGVWLWGRVAPDFVANACLVAFAVLALPVGFVVFRRLPGPFAADPASIRRMLRYGLPCVSTTLPQQLNLRLDQVSIAAFLPPKELGLYVVAVAWSGALAPLLHSVAGSLLPAVASEATPEGRARAFAKGSRLAVLLAIGSAVIALIVTPMAVVVLFGAAFHGAIPAALVLVPAAAVAGLNVVAGEGLRGMGRPVEAMKAEFIGLGVTAVALALLLPRFGIMGAALASLLAYSTVTAALFTYARRLTGESTATLLLPRGPEIYSSVRRLRLLAREVW